MPLQGVCIPKFGKISVKLSVLGSHTLIIVPMGVKFGLEEWTIPCQILPPLMQCIAPAGQKRPQNLPLSNLNTGVLCSAHCFQ